MKSKVFVSLMCLTLSFTSLVPATNVCAASECTHPETYEQIIQKPKCNDYGIYVLRCKKCEKQVGSLRYIQPSPSFHEASYFDSGIAGTRYCKHCFRWY